ncbi:MAG: helix-turn-helix domain-containing protein [Oligoflexus sp.]
MFLEGRIFKDGKSWAAEIPTLDFETQAKTQKEALTMIEDLCNVMFETDKTGIRDFSIELVDKQNGIFKFSTPHIAELLPYILKRQRSLAAISQGELARRVGSKSHNSIAAYELGDRQPTVQKLAEILAGLDLDLGISITTKKERIDA